MSLADVIRGAVATAKSVTAPLEVDITHEAWTGLDNSTKPTYATGVTLSALVEQGPVPFRTALGETVEVKAIVTILQPVTANGASGREEPIDPRDQITLPNGTIGAPIVATPEPGLVDPSTSVPYFHRVALG
jgi:hypothetical protein